MEAIPCGTEIVTKIGNIRAIITGVCIRFEKVQYEVAYFLNGDRKEVWLDEREFTTEAKKQTIGFARP